MGKVVPAAFMSYAHFDDEHGEGRITMLCKRLSGEVKAQTGDEFPIFQDQKDLQWGESWNERIKLTMSEVTFLIPVVTPTYFKRPECRRELTEFMEYEKRLNRNDLVLPIYWIECELLEKQDLRKGDPLAVLVASRHRADLRDLRFEAFNSPEVGKRVARMARHIVDALRRTARTVPLPDDMICKEVPQASPVFEKTSVKWPPIGDTTVIEGVGFRKVVIGASVEEVIEQLGPPEQRIDSQMVWFTYYAKYGLDVLFVGGIAREIRFDPGFPFPLARGPSIGTPLEDVLRVYGKPVRYEKANRNSELLADQILYRLPSASKIIYQSQGVAFWFDKQHKVSQFVIIPPNK